MKIDNVVQVGLLRLCVGCGACASICPEKMLEMVDIENDGLRPIMAIKKKTYMQGYCKSCSLCLEVCPGLNTIIESKEYRSDSIKELRKQWGTVLEVWEGHASDPEIRFKGSSGGICTALSLFCLENDIAGGVLHIGSDTEKPWKNRTYRSTNKEEIVSRAGSRYSPASPCEELKRIEEADSASVFVGKPCDVAGLRMVQKKKNKIAINTAVSIGFFCAGTPSTVGTLEFLRKFGIDQNSLKEFRYRGMGWPGMATALLKDGKSPPIKFTYNESWGFLQKYRPFRCYLCPDLTAEFADISVGDPWYRKFSKDEIGKSLVLIRTENGRDIFRKAIDKGYITAKTSDPKIVFLSQSNLLGKRQAIWGRLLSLKMLRAHCPNIDGFHLFENWLDLPFKEKIKSVVGTVRRIIQRNYRKPIKYKTINGSWLTTEYVSKDAIKKIKK